MSDMVTIDDLINAAKQEKWDYVDKNISRISNDPNTPERALKLLNDSDGNVRDLGASILGKLHVSERQFVMMRGKLAEVMLGDSNPYARYRAAFALAEHGPGPYNGKVLQTLHEAEKDNDVGVIAKKYLKRLG